MARLIHYSLKVASREKARDFFVNSLGMRVLRHEEYSEGCKVECNGPYKNRWSKTMVGFGSEDTHFVIELIYNYDVHKYEPRNDFVGVFIESSEVYIRCTEKLLGEMAAFEGDFYLRVRDPDGHAFYIKKGIRRPEPMFKVGLSTNDMAKTLEYYTDVLGMKEIEKLKSRTIIGFENDRTYLEWHDLSEPLNRGNGYGRIAFSVPKAELEPLQEKIKQKEQTILHPLQLLGSGKTKESVVILADPNDHEICFVGEEAFLELSEEDYGSDDKLAFQMEKEQDEIDKKSRMSKQK